MQKGKSFILTEYLKAANRYFEKSIFSYTTFLESFFLFQRFYKINIRTLLLILSSVFFQLQAQSEKENWILVDINSSSKTYINTVGIEVFQGNDIYVWVMEENDLQFEIEGINTKIYKTKTYYLLNKDLKRYSILQIIYYDAKNNVIKSYSYERNMDNPDFKYSSPILIDSNVESILLKCNDIIHSKKN
ncbi:MAG: hypothetical protein RDU14_02490 [Melioribacteraceae bacterium]|nr:hypothetical protein [Melioribacteraceae bacterium]